MPFPRLSRPSRTYAGALVAALALAAPRAHAQTHLLTFDAGSSVAAFGTSVGPYAGTLTTTPPGTSSAITLFCDDILNTVSPGETFAVFLSPLLGDLGNTRGGNGALASYKRVAWLSAQFALEPTSNWGGIQAAIWESMSPGAPNGGADPLAPTDEAYWLAAAGSAEAGGYAGFDFTPFAIVTDVAATKGAFVADGFHQEFLTNDGVVTPEPASLALLGAGLLALGGAARVRRRVR